MNDAYENKIAVVTGAGSGIGRAIAIDLMKRGCRVVLVGRRHKKLQQTLLDAGTESDNTLLRSVDIRRTAEVESLEREIMSTWGTVQILVNNAGLYGEYTNIRDSRPEVWIDVVHTNLVGPYLMSRIFLTSMMASGWGRIINVSSRAGLGAPNNMHSCYGLSKAALNHFTRQLAREIAGTGVTANAVHPGEVKTEMFEAARSDSLNRGLGIRKGWLQYVEETGGDPLSLSVELVNALMDGEYTHLNGHFLWKPPGADGFETAWESEKEQQ